MRFFIKKEYNPAGRLWNTWDVIDRATYKPVARSRDEKTALIIRHNLNGAGLTFKRACA